MKRLIKKSIGGINESDLEFEVNNDKIVAYLINPSKMRAGNSNWLYLYDAFGDNYIEETEEKILVGYITYSTFESIIEIGYLEIDERYQNTSILKYLLKKFEQIVINPLIEKYDNEISIKTFFADGRLAQAIKNYCIKKGIALFDGNQEISNENPKLIKYDRVRTDKWNNLLDNLKSTGYSYIQDHTNDTFVFIGQQSELNSLDTSHFEIIINNNVSIISHASAYLLGSLKIMLSRCNMYHDENYVLVSKDGSLSSLDPQNYKKYMFKNNVGYLELVE